MDHDDTVEGGLLAMRYHTIGDGGPTVIGAVLACQWALLTLLAAEPGELQELKECLESEVTQPV
jgi:hypothetical protein